MARYEIHDHDQATIGGEAKADVFCEMGLMYATGRECEVDYIAAHKYRSYQGL